MDLVPGVANWNFWNFSMVLDLDLYLMIVKILLISNLSDTWYTQSNHDWWIKLLWLNVNKKLSACSFIYYSCYWNHLGHYRPIDLFKGIQSLIFTQCFFVLFFCFICFLGWLEAFSPKLVDSNIVYLFNNVC